MAVAASASHLECEMAHCQHSSDAVEEVESRDKLEQQAHVQHRQKGEQGKERVRKKLRKRELLLKSLQLMSN